MSNSITVVIPMVNELHLVQRCVSSVIINTVAAYSIEVIIVNDGDLTNSEIMMQLRNFETFDIRIYKNKYKSGPGGARNTGLDFATGQYLAFLDVDDVWLPDKLSAQVEKLAAGWQFCCTGYKISRGCKLVKPSSSIIDAADILIKGGVGTSTVIVDRDLIGGKRFSDLKFGQDVEFWYRILKDEPSTFCGLGACLAEYASGGRTRNKFNQMLFMIRVIRIMDMPINLKIYAFLSYIKRGVRNHFL